MACCDETVHPCEEISGIFERSVNTLWDYRNKIQSKSWPYFQSADNRNIYLGRNSKNISISYLKNVYRDKRPCTKWCFHWER